MDTRTRSREGNSTTPSLRRLTARPTLLKQLVDRALSALGAPLAPQPRTVFETFEPRVLLSGDPVAPPRIDGSLDVAGETDRYTFTLTDDLRVVFDSLTSNGNIRWSLDGPRGNIVTSRSFGNSDSADLGGDIALSAYVVWYR